MWSFEYSDLAMHRRQRRLSSTQQQQFVGGELFLEAQPVLFIAGID